MLAVPFVLMLPSVSLPSILPAASVSLYAEFAYLVPVLVYFLPTEMLTYAPPSMTVTPFSATAKSAENESSMTSASIDEAILFI